MKTLGDQHEENEEKSSAETFFTKLTGLLYIAAALVTLLATISR
jgi:hypothetical protein